MVSIIIAAVGVGLSLLAASLQKKPKSPSPLRDDKQPTMSERGSYIPLVIGKRRVAPVVCWVGHRSTKTHTVGGGGGGSFGGGGGVESITYYEYGIHALCVGPADELSLIADDGKVISSDTFTRIANPSGTSISVAHHGSFLMHWGECDQASLVEPFVTGVGVDTRAPHIVHADWIKTPLGAAPRWPSREYEILCKFDGATPLVNSSSWITGYPRTTGDGMNAAHAIYMLLTAPFPHGCGMEPDWLDLDAFEELGVLCEDEGLAVNLLCRDGVDVGTVLTGLMNDIGMMMPQNGALLVPTPIRAPFYSLPVMSVDVQAAPEPEIGGVVGVPNTARVNYTFADAAHSFRTNAVKFDNDSQAELVGRFKGTQVSLDSITNYDLAALVADRRQQEEFAKATVFRFTGLRGSRLLRPGGLFDHPVYGRLRTATVQLDTETSDTIIEAFRDLYSIDATGFTPPAPPPAPEPGDGAPEPDTAFRPFELPTELAVAGHVTMTVLRAPANQNSIGSVIWLSADDTTYRVLGNQNIPAVSGLLLDDMDYLPDDIEDGPTFTIDSGSDAADVEDLTDNVPAWEAGAQLLVIDDEIFFVRNIEALGGSTYQLHGLKRAQYSTISATHLTGARIWIVDPNEQSRFTDGLIVSAATVYAKSQPFTASDEVDLGDVTGESVTFS